MDERALRGRPQVEFCRWKDCTFITCIEKQQLCVVVRDRNREDKVLVCEDGMKLTAERALLD